MLAGTERLLPVDQFQTLKQHLIMDAKVAVADGDGSRYVADMVALVRMAGHCSQIEGGVFCDGRAFSLCLAAMDSICGIAIYRYEWLTDAQFAALAEEIDQFDRGEIALDFDHEVRSVEDFVQRAYTDDGQGDGYLFVPAETKLHTPNYTLNWVERIPLPIQPTKKLRRRQLLECAQEFGRLARNDAKTPLWQLSSLASMEHWNLISTRYGEAIPDLAMSEMDTVLFILAPKYHAQYSAATRMAIACARFRNMMGAWPSVAEDLVPDYLAELPIDQLTGQPLRYVQFDGEPFVYSACLDGDDDRGKGTLYEKVNLLRWFEDRKKSGYVPPDGDWLLWPTSACEVAILPLLH